MINGVAGYSCQWRQREVMIAAAEQKTIVRQVGFCDFLAKRSNGAEAAFRPNG
jgi:hypothetical protein